MSYNKYKAYLETLGEVIREYAIEAKKQKDIAIATDRENFATGYLSGFYRIITIMQQHAEAYEIPPEELGR